MESNIIKKSFVRIALAALVAVQTACGGNPGDEPADSDRREMIVRFTLPLARSGGYSDPEIQDGYVPGTPDENYIDVNKRCRVLFFSASNTYIGQLGRQTVADIGGTEYRQYNLCGIPPENLPADFKVMIAANWPDMSAIDNAVAGASTIDDICHDLASQFEVAAGFIPVPSRDDLIPFFGIHSYKDVVVQPGTTTLTEPITLLRALAKIEVVFDGGLSDSGATVQLCGFNVKGYCAPMGVYSQDDYGQGENWDTDYLHRLHLVSADNNNEPASGQRRMDIPSTYAGGVYCHTVYVPEYRNILSDGTPSSDEACIEIRLSSQSAGEKPFRLYFARYAGSSSTNTALPRYNIERNNIYRFNVTLHNGLMIITARPWNYRPQPEINA